MQVSGFNSSMGRDQFLKLLVTQIKNQNPMDPMQNQEFMGQLAQFSTLEGIEKLNANFADMLSLEQLTQGANLVGRTVIYNHSDPSAPGRGVVDGVSVEGGKLQLFVNGTLVPLSQVSGMVGSGAKR